jgi:hypothetical protein
MKIRGARKIVAVAAAAGIAATLGATAGASAAPQRLNCVLTGTSAQPPSQSQPIVVVFDDTAETLQAQAGNKRYSFSNVSISNVAISGDVDDVSLGIDRSSLGMVWQQYGSENVTTEYGQCQPPPASTGGQ